MSGVANTRHWHEVLVDVAGLDVANIGSDVCGGQGDIALAASTSWQGCTKRRACGDGQERGGLDKSGGDGEHYKAWCRW